MLKTKLLGASIAMGICALALNSCGTNQNNSPNAQSRAAAGNTVTVSIPNGAVGMGPAAYGANPLVIPQGTSVIWTNNDTSDGAPHTATSDSGVFDTGSIAVGQSSSPIPFNSPGTFPYHCSIHGAASMSGVIQVTTASPSPSPSPSASASPSPSASPSASPSPSVSPSPSASPSVTPTMTPVPKQGGGVVYRSR